MSDGIPVKEWMEKAEKDPSVKPARPEAKDKKGPAILVIVSAGKDEDSAVSWVAEALTKSLPGAEVAEYHLPSLKISPCSGCYAAGGRVCQGLCDRNDVESDIFVANDSMPVLTEKMEACDAVLIVSDVRSGGANHGVQRFLERLHPYRRPSDQRLRGKWASGFFVGPSAEVIGHSVIGALTSLGFRSPGPVGSWALPHEVAQDDARRIFQKSDALKGVIARVASNLIDTIKEKKE